MYAASTAKNKDWTSAVECYSQVRDIIRCDITTRGVYIRHNLHVTTDDCQC